MVSQVVITLLLGPYYCISGDFLGCCQVVAMVSQSGYQVVTASLLQYFNWFSRLLGGCYGIPSGYQITRSLLLYFRWFSKLLLGGCYGVSQVVITLLQAPYYSISSGFLVCCQVVVMLLLWHPRRLLGFSQAVGIYGISASVLAGSQSASGRSNADFN